MYLLTIVSYSILLLSTAAYSAVVRGRDEAQDDMITITIFDCSPTVSSFAYRLVCSASTDPDDSDDRNFCETQLPSAPSSPPGGSQGISTWTTPQEGDMPNGCEPGSEGLRAVGILHVEVGTMISFGMVEIVNATTEGSRLSVETKANRCEFDIKEFPGDTELFWWFNAPTSLEGEFAARNGKLEPGSVVPVCWGTLSGME